MTRHRVLLHTAGPALWPEHKPLSEVLEIKDLTPEPIWESTYQGNPTPPAGYIFKRSWWAGGRNRYNAGDSKIKNRVSGRYISWDTAEKADDHNAFTSCAVGEILDDYTLVTRYIYRERLEFPMLTDAIEREARRWNYDDKLRAIIIEDKSSGTSAYQTLIKSLPSELASLLIAWQPSGDKVQRFQQAALWCRNDDERDGCVLLPHPSEDVPWLMDFEDELFTLPEAVFKDQGDAFSQLVIYLENYLAAGYHGRA